MHKFYKTVISNVNVIAYTIKTIYIDFKNFIFHLTFANSQSKLIERIVIERIIYFNHKIQID